MVISVYRLLGTQNSVSILAKILFFNSFHTHTCTLHTHTHTHYTYAHTVMWLTHITRKWFPLQGKRAHSLYFFVCTLRILSFKKQNRQNNNRPFNLPKVIYILHKLQVHHLTLTFIIHNKYISTLCLSESTYSTLYVGLAYTYIIHNQRVR